MALSKPGASGAEAPAQGSLCWPAGKQQRGAGAGPAARAPGPRPAPRLLWSTLSPSSCPGGPSRDDGAFLVHPHQQSGAARAGALSGCVPRQSEPHWPPLLNGAEGLLPAPSLLQGRPVRVAVLDTRACPICRYQPRPAQLPPLTGTSHRGPAPPQGVCRPLCLGLCHGALSPAAPGPGLPPSLPPSPLLPWAGPSWLLTDFRPPLGPGGMWAPLSLPLSRPPGGGEGGSGPRGRLTSVLRPREPGGGQRAAECRVSERRLWQVTEVGLLGVFEERDAMPSGDSAAQVLAAG